MSINNLAHEIGVHIPKILLPAKGTDMSKWSVVACDQYTSQPEYWANVKNYVGDSPSTLNIIFPEVYLEDKNADERIKKINLTMKEYLDKGIFNELSEGFIYVDRQTTNAPSRKGLIIALDLEQYDYNRGSQTLIRATEGTVLDRLPPRIRIREKASLESPHIMVLIDDPEKTVIEPLASQTDKMEKLYDFDLMMDGKHIKGYKVDDEAVILNILKALKRLADPDTFKEKYNVGADKGVLLFAVGDGNHSLATAKACWEDLKKSLSEDEQKNHPARYALVELVNVHDEGLKFEPIHRVVFGVNPDELLKAFVDYCKASGMEAYIASASELQADNFNEQSSCEGRDSNLQSNCHNQSTCRSQSEHIIGFTDSAKTGRIVIKNPKHTLEVGTLQAFLDEYIGKNKGVKIDYIHGEDVVKKLGTKDGNIGFFLPAMNKNNLFKTVILDGVLPRKTFSMGEAKEKRFYLECRKIVK